MKSPYRFNWMPLITGTIVGFVADFFVFYYLITSETTHIARSLLLFCVMILFGFIGFAFSVYNMKSKTIFHKQVTNPVNPNLLVPGQIYWLNGETHATYLAYDGQTGNFLFHIYGVDNENDPGSGQMLNSYMIFHFISKTEEK